MVHSIKLEGKFGVIILVLSILLSGWSTIIAGILAKGDYVKPAVVIGSLQLVTTPLLVGWLWAIYTGYTIWNNTKVRAARAI
ncbi:MAG: hypothetical protein ACKO96_24285 [Flammeovirgaceae bacterium]